MSKASIWFPAILACVGLLWALNPDNPYGYYLFLRWLVCPACLYIAARSHRESMTGWTWIFAVLAVMYNPFLRVSLTREFWSIVNILTVIIILGGSIKLGKRNRAA